MCEWRTSPASGSHAINGVAELHSRLLQETVLRDFHQLWPQKIPEQDQWSHPTPFPDVEQPGAQRAADPEPRQGLGKRSVSPCGHLEKHADDAAFQSEWQRVKLDAKTRLAAIIGRDCGIVVDPHSLFDVQAKRIMSTSASISTCCTSSRSINASSRTQARQ